MSIAQADKAGGASQRGSHRLSQIAQCERAWFLSWVRRLAPKDRKPALVEGSAVHAALAYHWAGQMANPPAWFHRETLDAALDRESKGMPEAKKLALAVRDAYARFYGGGDDPWTAEAVEKEYFATVGALRQMTRPGCAPSPFDGEQVSARIDLVARVNGRLWAVDHKTSRGGYGARGPTLPRWNPDGEWSHSFQFLLQTLIMRHNFGAEFGGVVVQRIKTSEPFDFDRNVVSISPQVLVDGPEAVLKQVAHEAALAQRFREAVAAGAKPEQWLPAGSFWSCWSWGAPCQFRPLCAAEPEQRATVVAYDYEQRE